MKLSTRLASINGEGVEDDGWGILYAARAREAKGDAITMLCIGDHDVPTPAPILEATKAALDAGNTRYAPINGPLALRTAIAERVESRTGVETRADNVFVTTGGQGALFSAMMGAIDAGDTAAIIDPYYATYVQTVRTAGGKTAIIAANPDNGFQIDREALLDGTKGARALLVNTPHNPTGAVYDAETLAAIREASLTHDLWCLSDEVYDGQVHAGTHVSPRSLPDMAERTLVIGSFSKSHVMTGFRIGWLIGPAAFIAAMTDLTNATTYGAPGFIQDAALAALAETETEAEIAARYTARRNAALAALEGRNALAVSPPSGAMYVMLDIRATGCSGKDFAQALLDEEDIAVMPGESFGKAAAGHIRVALTQPAPILIDALGRIADLAQRLGDAP